jgi:hypothetical protein
VGKPDGIGGRPLGNVVGMAGRLVGNGDGKPDGMVHGVPGGEPGGGGTLAAGCPGNGWDGP